MTEKELYFNNVFIMSATTVRVLGEFNKLLSEQNPAKISVLLKFSIETLQLIMNDVNIMIMNEIKNGTDVKKSLDEGLFILQHILSEVQLLTSETKGKVC